MQITLLSPYLIASITHQPLLSLPFSPQPFLLHASHYHTNNRGELLFMSGMANRHKPLTEHRFIHHASMPYSFETHSP